MKHTEKFLKQRKFYMMLPVLALPFLTLIFWALGGGKGSTVQAMPLNEGLNTELPNAQFEPEKEEDLWDKFALYERTARDSAEYETARENDPYFDLTTFQSKPKEDDSKLIGTFKRRDRLIDPNEAKVNSKLEQLYQEISKASDPQAESQPDPAISKDPQFTEDVSRLESMMEQIQDEAKGQGRGERNDDQDPEMTEINSMLEKLMDVQHPERVKDRMKATKSITKPKSFEVVPIDADHSRSISSLTEPDKQLNDSVAVVEIVGNNFFDLDDVSTSNQQPVNTIPAIIHETQELITGATVRLRLLQDVTINNTVIPKDQFIYGTCAINGERVMIEVTSILNGQTLTPISLSVYDLSGLEGIYVRGAMSRDAAKQASDDALQGMQLMSMDQSIGLQAASAGIEATKGLISRTTKLVKVIVKAGHQVVLRNKIEQ